MNAAERPNRHDFNFSMGAESKRKLDDLMSRCGHTQLNLTVARALALLAWVEDQSDLGRVVGSIRYGDELDFVELEERAELLRPRPRPHLVPAAAPIAEVVAPIEPAPAPEPTPQPEPAPEPAPVEPAPLTATTNPKLMARPRVAPAPSAPLRERSRRLMKHLAYEQDDNGPIKTLKYLQANCKARGLPQPVAYGVHCMPGNLYKHHEQRLIEIMDNHPTATHFRVAALTEDLSFCSYSPEKGWCEYDESSGRWIKDMNLYHGASWIYPVIHAVEYLRRFGKESPNPPQFEDSCPNF